jgi:hypothetical protein
MADAAASKAAEATHVGSTPTFPMRFEHRNGGLGSDQRFSEPGRRLELLVVIA